MADRGTTTAAQRLEIVRRATGCVDNKAGFARWIGAASPQAVDAWAARNRITPDGAQKIHRTTGASTHWLQFGEGEPFPDGAKPFPGAAVGDARIAELEERLMYVQSAQTAIVRVLSGMRSGAGQELAQALLALAGEGQSLPPEIALLADAAKEAGRLAAPASRRGAQEESGGKPPRKGR
jgi:hypothetical protein